MIPSCEHCQYVNTCTYPWKFSDKIECDDFKLARRMIDETILKDKIICPYCGFEDKYPFEGWDSMPTNPWVCYYCENCEEEFETYVEVELTVHIRGTK